MNRAPCVRLTPRWLRPVSAGFAALAYGALFAALAAGVTQPPIMAPQADVIMISVGEATPDSREASVSSVEAAASPQTEQEPAPEKAASTVETSIPPVQVPAVEPPAIQPLAREAKPDQPIAKRRAEPRHIALKRLKPRPRPKPVRRPVVDDDDDDDEEEEEEEAIQPRRRAAIPKRTAMHSGSSSSLARAARSGATSAPAQPSAASKAAYGAIVAAELNRRKAYPGAARAIGATGAVSVAYAVGPAGRMASHSIIRSSGHASLDAAARSMFRSAQLPPPPGGSFRSSVTIHFNLAR